MKPPFRKSAMDKMSSPEQLDQLIQITNPRSWIILVSVSLIIVTGLIWGFVGVIRDTVDSRGILIQTGGIYDIVATSAGQVHEILYKEDSFIKAGDIVAIITQPELKKALSDNTEKIKELKRQHDELESFGAKDLQLQQKLLSDKKAMLVESFQRVNEKIAWLADQVEVSDGLFKRGLITKSNHLQTKQNLSMAREELSRLENRSKEIDKSEYDLKFQQKRELERSVQQLNEIERGQQSLKEKMDRDSKIRSPYSGKILDISVDVGSLVNLGVQIAKLEIEDDNKGLKGILYVSGNDGKKVKDGMEVQIMPGPVKAEEYGVMFGIVKSIAEFPSTTQGMLQSLKNDQLVRQLSMLGAPFEVTVEPTENIHTISGYKWSSSDGPPFQIESNTPCVAKITVNKKRPISLVMPFLRKTIGIVPVVIPLPAS